VNVYIMTDMEGISGIFCSQQVSAGDPLYKDGCRIAMQDVNVVVRACKEAGCEKVYVRDAHGFGEAVWGELCSEADGYIMGNTGANRFPFLDECDAVILLGYHAMAGTPAGTLEHSMNSRRIQNYWINNLPAGETALDAGIAGDKGKSVILVTGDDKVCAEAKKLLPWVVTAEVKKGLTVMGAMLLPQAKAHALLREKTIEAIRNFSNTQPLVFEKPVHLRVEVLERCGVPNSYAHPYAKVIDGHTYEVTGDTLEEALYRQYV